MKPIDWSKLETFDDWAKTLNGLLDEARAAVAAKDAARMESVVNELVEFQEESPNASCRTLDQIADRAAKDVIASAVSGAVDSIAGRSGELAQYLKEVRAIVAETSEGASRIRLDRAKELAVASSSVIQAAISLRAELSTGKDDTALAAKIEAAVAAVQELRNAVETTDHA